MKKITINGNYHDKPLDIFIFKTHKPVVQVTVFIHGLYGVFDPMENTDKVNMLSNKLIKSGITHCVHYNSSRDFQYDSNTDYNKRREAFIDKTFLQELEDLKNVLRIVIKNSKQIFNIKETDLVLYIHGNSIGGTFALLLKEFFSKIKKISLCGSGCGTNGSTKPILSTFFKETDILKSINSFEGELFLLQGEEDSVVPRESGIKILQHAVKSKKLHTVICGANHNFSKIHDIENTEAKKEFVKVLFDFISSK